MAIRSRWVEGMICECEDASGHKVIGDEPVEIGGTNTAPSPFALLEMALAN